MKAVVYTRYGSPDVLRFTEVEKPAPKDKQVLVKVQAVSLNRSDWEALRGKPLYARIMGPLRPRHHILGSDIAGRVEATGRTTTRFQPGDDVFADILSSMGGFAEYVCVPESALAPMPAGMTYEEAAALPQAGAIALQGIWDKGQVQPGQKVLINGAGGGSGMYAVQLAKLRGGRGHRGGQPREAGVHPLTRCRPCHRLHAGGLHQEWAQLRVDSGSRRPSFGPGLRGRAGARGTLFVCWRIGGDAVAGAADRAVAGKSREQEAPTPRRSTRCGAPDAAGCALPGRNDRDGHRPSLSVA